MIQFFTNTAFVAIAIPRQARIPQIQLNICLLRLSEGGFR